MAAAKYVAIGAPIAASITAWCVHPPPAGPSQTPVYEVVLLRPPCALDDDTQLPTSANRAVVVEGVTGPPAACRLTFGVGVLSPITPVVGS